MNALMLKLRQRWNENSPLLFALKALRYPFRPLFAQGAADALAREARGASTHADAVRMIKAFKYRGITVTPWQVDEEIVGLLDLLEREAPRTVVDIGTADGGTLFLLTRALPEDALIVSVDLKGGRFGGGYPTWRGRIYRSFARGGQRIELVRGDSHAAATLERVRSLLAGREADFLFIDGDHRYEGVKSDFEMYSPLVRGGGLVGFHDIIPGPPELVGGVPTFWQELKRDRESQELVHDWQFGSCGIGIVRLPQVAALDAAAATAAVST